MLQYLFFGSLLSTCPTKMATEKWPKAADFPLFTDFYFLNIFFNFLDILSIIFI